MTADPIRVLFVCTHNSARSQIAEALLGRYGGADFEAASAGTEASRVNPLAIRALAEVGIDWSHAESKAIGRFLDQPFDYVITVCDHAKATCPVVPGAATTLHWSVEDPSEVEGSEAERLAAFRQTRTELVDRVRTFVADARGATGRPTSTTTA